MKYLLIMIIFVSTLIYAETVEQSISKAKSEIQKGNIQKATDIMKKAIDDNPNSANAEAEYGLCLSQLAGKSNFLKAGMLSQKAFVHLNKALKIDPGNVNATLYRGILGVNVPKFMGKLNQAIKDLEYIQKNMDKTSIYIWFQIITFLLVILKIMKKKKRNQDSNSSYYRGKILNIINRQNRNMQNW